MYSWDLKELESRKEELLRIKKLKRKRLSEEKLLKLNSSLSTYDYLLSILKNINPYYSEEAPDNDKRFVTTRFLDVYTSTNPNIILSTINAIDVFEDSNVEICFDSNSNTYLDNETVIKMTREIFSSFNNPSIMEFVDEALNPNNHLLHITKDNSSSIYETSYSGFSCRDYYNNIGYAIIYSNEKIRDLYTLVHELFHLIITDGKMPTNLYNDNFYVSEIEGSFADLIVTDYLIRKEIMVDEAKNVELINYSNARYFIRNLHLAHNFHNYFDGNNFDIKRINQRLEIQGLPYKVDHEDMLNVIDSFSRDLNYGFSFLIALDLFYKHKNGYKNIIDDIRYISNGKNPFIWFERYNIKFFDDGYKNLSHYQKTLKQNKR